MIVCLVCYLIETDPFNKSLLCLLYQTYSGDATLYSLQLSTQSLVVFHKSTPRLSEGECSIYFLLCYNSAEHLD